MSYIRKTIVDEERAGERLDLFVCEEVDSLSRSLAKKLITDNRVIVDGEFRKPSYRVRLGEVITIDIPKQKEIEVKAQKIELKIVYQDEDIAIINKPKGIVVHPAHGNWDNTLVNALLYNFRTLSQVSGKLRPGIVHRLDKDTSGLMIVAKNDEAHLDLAQQIKEHRLRREYTALVFGRIKENAGTIEAPIGRSTNDRKRMAVVADGKQALSSYSVIERFDKYTLVNVRLITGRTHQIRVHFAYIKHPIVGDQVYGYRRNQWGLASQALHAHLLGLLHPRQKEYMEFISQLPDYMKNIIAELKKY